MQVGKNKCIISIDAISKNRDEFGLLSSSRQWQYSTGTSMLWCHASNSCDASNIIHLKTRRTIRLDIYTYPHIRGRLSSIYDLPPASKFLSIWGKFPRILMVHVGCFRNFADTELRGIKSLRIKFRISRLHKVTFINTLGFCTYTNH